MHHCQQARYVHQFVHQLSAWLNVSHIQCTLGKGYPRYLRIIYTACYTLQVFKLLTTCQLPAPSFAWVVNIGICKCLALAVLITRVGVYKSYYFVKYKALFMTRMTGMTRNMKTTSDTETANKVSEKLSFLSLLSWDV